MTLNCSRAGIDRIEWRMLGTGTKIFVMTKKISAMLGRRSTIVEKKDGTIERMSAISGIVSMFVRKISAICVRIEQTAAEATQTDRRIGKAAKRVTAIIAGTKNTAERTFPLVRVKQTTRQETTTSGEENSTNLMMVTTIAVATRMNAGNSIEIGKMTRPTDRKNFVAATEIGMIKKRVIPPGRITGAVTAKDHADNKLMRMWRWNFRDIHNFMGRPGYKQKKCVTKNSH